MSGRISPQLLDNMLKSLGDDYFAFFTPEEIEQHFEAIAELGERNTFRVFFSEPQAVSGGYRFNCTVLGYDSPALFSIITGALAGAGVSIEHGKIFTCTSRKDESVAPHRKHQRYFRRLTKISRQRIPVIDTLQCFWNPLPGSELQEIGKIHEWMQRILSLHYSSSEEERLLARHQVNERVVWSLQHRMQAEIRTAGTPVNVDISPVSDDLLKLEVTCEDTPAFLYALSSGLALEGIAIHRVHIDTDEHGVIRDTLWISNPKRWWQQSRQERGTEYLRFIVIFIKEFTYYLPNAPDPYAALSRFDQILRDVVEDNNHVLSSEFIKKPQLMARLARVLGTSEFLWEDFIRQHYEDIVPLLDEGSRSLEEPLIPALREELRNEIANCETYQDKVRVLNQWKDQVLFHCDLWHILHDDVTFRNLAEKLTELAEVVVDEAAQLVFQHLRERWGTPRTAMGKEVPWAILGLGKFGGRALGYASDIELMFVYSDNGYTDGEDDNRVANSRFFSELVSEFSRAIHAKREGIFTIDLRLRPYGKDGPLAVSLEHFCRYYGPQGMAHAYERLALVRMRHICGDEALGKRLERLRDQFVYTMNLIDPQDILELRQRQIQEKHSPGRFNAKYDAGALVDVEYTVQILQVMAGGKNPAMRTSSIHEALAALASCGILSEEEHQELNRAYDFLRELINGLRMLRGSAQDLFLPREGSLEFRHLARRMRYHEQNGLMPDQLLLMDFRRNTAVVRAFVQRHFGKDTLPPRQKTVFDILVNPDIDPEEIRQILEREGFYEPEKTAANLKALNAMGKEGRIFLELFSLARDILIEFPNPDDTLNQWERFCARLENPQEHFRLLLSEPQRLEILLQIFSRSPFLTEILINHSENFDFLSEPTVCSRIWQVDDFTTFITREQGQRPPSVEEDDWLRLLRNRLLLRSAVRDFCLNSPFEVTVCELSDMADAFIRLVWQQCLAESAAGNESLAAALGAHSSIFAFGKLGGRELNYSSDIDLLIIFFEDTGAALPEPAPILCEHLHRSAVRLRSRLADRRPTGHLYRVDFRLRPFGSAGPLIVHAETMLNYIRQQARLWELQAMLKLREITPSTEQSASFFRKLQNCLKMRTFVPEEVAANICHMRAESLKIQRHKRIQSIDIKNGIGGIRDIEFVVQYLQLINLQKNSELWTGNTLEAITRLQAAGKLSPSQAEQLRNNYLVLRRSEHVLQLIDDRQVHRLPRSLTLQRYAIHQILSRNADIQELESFLDQRMRQNYRLFSKIVGAYA